MPAEQVNPIVIIETSQGTIKAELWPDKAPLTVESFLKYVESDYYTGTIFHRVISNFMIQGGGFTEAMVQKKTNAPVKNEAKADVGNARGTLAMARTSIVDSATSQFFINLVDNTFLNHKNETAQGFGYCVFGKVTEGLDIVDKIGQAKTQRGDVPVEAIIIKSIKVVK
ncbi:MAG: peptidylprolyl isomerase [Kiritimatiellae bacterium]|nr:peptidylprolyl isomerase [Kiritimatiellia bacterium]